MNLQISSSFNYIKKKKNLKKINNKIIKKEVDINFLGQSIDSIT